MSDIKTIIYPSHFRPISPTALYNLNPLTGGNPRKFYNYITGNMPEEPETSAMRMGKLVHLYMEHSGVLQIIESPRPTDKAGQVADEAIRMIKFKLANSQEITTVGDEVLAAARAIGWNNNWKDEAILKNLQHVIEYVEVAIEFESQGKMGISDEEFKTVVQAANALISCGGYKNTVNVPNSDSINEHKFVFNYGFGLDRNVEFKDGGDRQVVDTIVGEVSPFYQEPTKIYMDIPMKCIADKLIVNVDSIAILDYKMTRTEIAGILDYHQIANDDYKQLSKKLAHTHIQTAIYHHALTDYLFNNKHYNFTSMLGTLFVQLGDFVSKSVFYDQAYRQTAHNYLMVLLCRLAKHIETDNWSEFAEDLDMNFETNIGASPKLFV